jgi:hypothetical protein
MSIISLPHNLLKEKLPSIHATRFTALMAAVVALLNMTAENGSAAMLDRAHEAALPWLRDSACC